MIKKSTHACSSGLAQFPPLSFDIYPPFPSTHVTHLDCTWVWVSNSWGNNKECWLLLSQFSKCLQVNISAGHETNTDNLYNLKFEITAQYCLFSGKYTPRKPGRVMINRREYWPFQRNYAWHLYNKHCKMKNRQENCRIQPTREWIHREHSLDVNLVN